jgi:hypothetical protein
VYTTKALTLFPNCFGKHLVAFILFYYFLPTKISHWIGATIKVYIFSQKSDIVNEKTIYITLKLDETSYQLLYNTVQVGILIH